MSVSFDSQEVSSSRHQQVTRSLPRGLDRLYSVTRWMRPRNVFSKINRNSTDDTILTYKDARYIHGMIGKETTTQSLSIHLIASHPILSHFTLLPCTMATPALVPAPALPPDLSFSVPNPAKFSASPKQELRRYVAWLLRESEVPAFLWGPEVTRIYGSNTDFEVSVLEYSLPLHLV